MFCYMVSSIPLKYEQFLNRFFYPLIRLQQILQELDWFGLVSLFNTKAILLEEQ